MSRIRVIANPKSGKNSHDSEAIDRALAVLGPDAELHRLDEGEDFAAAVAKAVGDGVETVVAAGGDGTIMAIAGALEGTEVRMGVLPLGTFNYFARGLGIPEDAEQAAQIVLANRTRRISLGKVEDQLFLNNASLGVYPAILKERETVYKRWGRWRIAAHWSVVKVFIRFQRPMRATISVDGETRQVKTPLIFVARSAYQLEEFGLDGSDAIKNDEFAVFVARETSRAALFRMAWRLVRRKMREGEDYDLICSDTLSVDIPGKRVLVACDGEKFRKSAPLEFKMVPDALTIIIPESKG